MSVSDSFNDPFHLLLCDSLWSKASHPCIAHFDSDPLPPDLHPNLELDPDDPEPHPTPKLVPDEHSSDPLPRSVYRAWLASRVHTLQNGGYITAGAQRPLTRANLRLAQRIAELCMPQMLQIFWSRHPFRAFVMVALSFVRGTFPVFKGFTHALIINEASSVNSLYVISSDLPPFQIQSLISSGHFTWSHIIRLLGAEFLRLAAEKSFDSFA
jgi:hypothetical protein